MHLNECDQASSLIKKGREPDFYKFLNAEHKRNSFKFSFIPQFSTALCY